ncbi:MAG: hypothetical protein ACREV5_07020 [Steroidobacter sp.]
MRTIEQRDRGRIIAVHKSSFAESEIRLADGARTVVKEEFIVGRQAGLQLAQHGECVGRFIHSGERCQALLQLFNREFERRRRRLRGRLFGGDLRLR